VSSETIEESEANANNLLQKLSDWAIINKLDFNAEKTTCVLFTNKLKYKEPEIFLQNKKLKFSSSFKHLGVYLDSKLKFNIHANYVKSKASQLIINLISFAKCKFDLNSKALETINKGAVLPTISYASSVWIDAIDKEYVRKPLISKQRQIALRICKAYKTVSTEASNIISNLMPIDLYLKQTAINYYIKHGINNAFTESYLREFNTDLQYIQKPFRTEDLPHFTYRNKAKIVNEIKDQLIAYTDGSKSTNSVGAGFCITDGSTVVKTAKYKLSKHCSVFQAEMFAILNTIKYINANLKSNTSITVRTDSQSAIKALQNVNSTTVLVQDIYSQLRIAEQTPINISFAWIRGHGGNTGNELADKLAKMGAASHQSIEYELIPVSYVKKVVYQKNLQLWSERWINANTGETTRQLFPTVYDRINKILSKKK
jgi:ribonuclease HI